MEGDGRYMALELLNQNDSTLSQLYKADIFSFGMVLLQLITQIELPLKGEEWKRIRNPEYAQNLLSTAGCDCPLKEWILQCLDPDPKRRPEAKYIATAAQHRLIAMSISQPAESSCRLQNHYSSVPLPLAPPLPHPSIKHFPNIK